MDYQEVEKIYGPEVAKQILEEVYFNPLRLSEKKWFSRPTLEGYRSKAVKEVTNRRRSFYSTFNSLKEVFLSCFEVKNPFNGQEMEYKQMTGDAHQITLRFRSKNGDEIMISVPHDAIAVDFKSFKDADRNELLNEAFEIIEKPSTDLIAKAIGCLVTNGPFSYREARLHVFQKIRERAKNALMESNKKQAKSWLISIGFNEQEMCEFYEAVLGKFNEK